ALKELADSIQLNGVFQPIIVRQSSVKGYEIIVGERRVRASRLAGKESIPAIIREFDEQAMIEIAVIENLQREDLSPLEEAEAYQMMSDKLKLTQAQVAERVGKSRPYIANYLRLLTLPEDVKLLLRNGDLTMGQARTLLGLKDQKQMSELAKQVVQDGITVRQLEQLVQQMTEPIETKEKKKRQKIAKPSYILESEERLMDRFGTSVQITPKGEQGKIEIEYLSPNDLDRILELLNVEFDD
ncbi:MAG TPA: ParB/RepB/Spo0J family partition protein, partial [Candidatus Jeotgalibaca merdavium]|nr:ParB/RepB/Spo0J family partition protein [Candidatus Jeotgalibaca merdavium]